MVNALLIHDKDMVVVALADLEPGTPLMFERMNGQQVIVRERIPFGHKVALVPIPQGAHVIKYGASIGIATRDILPGEHVHVHNLQSVRGKAQ